MAYQDLEQASGRLMVSDPAGGTTGSDRQGNYRSQGSEAAAEKAALRGSLLSIVTIPPTAGPSPPSPSKRINVEQALIDRDLFMATFRCRCYRIAGPTSSLGPWISKTCGLLSMRDAAGAGSPGLLTWPLNFWLLGNRRVRLADA